MSGYLLSNFLWQSESAEMVRVLRWTSENVSVHCVMTDGEQRHVIAGGSQLVWFSCSLGSRLGWIQSRLMEYRPGMRERGGAVSDLFVKFYLTFDSNFEWRMADMLTQTLLTVVSTTALLVHHTMPENNLCLKKCHWVANMTRRVLLITWLDCLGCLSHLNVISL